MQLMESVGQVAADDRIDAEDVTNLAVTLQIPGGRIISGLLPVAQQVVDALQDDGRVDTQEALAIAGGIVSAVLAMRT